MRSLAVLSCHVQPSTVQVCPCVRLRARIVQEIRQMRSGRLVFPRLTSYHLPVTLSKSTLVLECPAHLLGLAENSMRSLTWVSDKHLTGWSCSECGWTFPLPSLLSDPEAKKAYDRLASAKFQRHDCATHQPVASLNPESFITRAKGLVMRGFKPKDAAEITAKEIMFENHDDLDIARKVQIEVNDFLRRVKEGLI